jgi:prefoldin subunit 5
MNGWDEAKSLIEYRLDRTDKIIERNTSALEELGQRLASIEQRIALRASVVGVMAGLTPAIVYLIYRLL